MIKRHSATFKVHVDEDGFLLIKNIHDAVECHFDLPYDQVDIKIIFCEDDHV